MSFKLHFLDVSQVFINTIKSELGSLETIFDKNNFNPKIKPTITCGVLEKFDHDISTYISPRHSEIIKDKKKQVNNLNNISITNNINNVNNIESIKNIKNIKPIGLFDCIVSPANSFGRMDGGFDALIANIFINGTNLDTNYNNSNKNNHLENKSFVTHAVQRQLYKKYKCMIPPGCSTIIDMSKSCLHYYNGEKGLDNKYLCKYIALTPTMRVPKVVTQNDIVYNCMWNILNAIENHNNLNKNNPENLIYNVLITGLGTGVGKIPPSLSAKQMILAYKHFLNTLILGEEECVLKSTWENAFQIDDEILATLDS